VQEMSYEREVFDREVAALKDEVGGKAVDRAYLVFAITIQWLRQWGHGNLILSAIDHVFGLKIRADTVFSVKEKKD